MRQALREADGGDGFSFASGGRGGCRDDDHFAAALERGIGEQFEPDFAAFRANLLEILVGEFQFERDFANREKSVGHESCELLGAKEDERGRKDYHNCGADHESANSSIVDQFPVSQARTKQNKIGSMSAIAILSPIAQAN